MITLFFVIVAGIIVANLALAVLITHGREIGIGLVSLAALAIGVLYVMANPKIVPELVSFVGVALFVAAVLVALFVHEKNENRKKSVANPHWRAEASARWVAEERRRVAERIALSERRSRAVAKFLERLIGRRTGAEKETARQEWLEVERVRRGVPNWRR